MGLYIIAGQAQHHLGTRGISCPLLEATGRRTVSLSGFQALQLILVKALFLSGIFQADVRT